MLRLLLSAAPAEATPALRARLASASAVQWPEKLPPPAAAPAGSVDVHAHRPARSLPRTAAGLDALAARHLAGAAPDRWRALHDALPTHRGTLPELLERLAELPVGDKPAPTPGNALGVLAELLDRVPVGTALAALPALPEAAVRAALTGRAPAPALAEAVADRGDGRSRIALADNSRTDARLLRVLVAAGDPAVNASVWRHQRTTQALRRTIIAAHPGVPLHPALRSRLLEENNDRRDNAPLLAATDPELLARGLAATDSRVSVQAWALDRLRERHGAEAARAVAAERCARKVGLALRSDDPAELRALVDDYADPRRLPALLARHRSTRAVQSYFEEPYAIDGALLVAAHRERPFAVHASAELVRHEAVDDEQREVFRLSLVNDHWQTDAPGGAFRVLVPPEQRLAEEAVHAGADIDGWARAAQRAGLLTAGRLLRLAHPVGPAAEALLGLADRQGRLPADAAEPLGALIAEHLAGHPDAWTVLVTLADSFAGTLTELVATAGAASGPRPEGDADAGLTPPQAAAPADPEAPEEPNTPLERAAASAVHLLRELAAGEDAAPPPLPRDDTALVAFLARTERADLPGLAVPAWLSAACRDAGLPDPAEELPPPDEDALLEAALDDRWRAWQPVTALYLAGLIPSATAAAAVPARNAYLARGAQGPAARAVDRLVGSTLASAIDGAEREGADADQQLRLAGRRAAAQYLSELLGNLHHGDRMLEFFERYQKKELKLAGPTEELLERSYSRYQRSDLLRVAAAAPAGTAELLVPALDVEERVALASHLARIAPVPHAPLSALLRERDPEVLARLAELAPDLDERSQAMLLELRHTPLAAALALDGARSVPGPDDRDAALAGLARLSGRERPLTQLTAVLRLLLAAGPEAVAAELPAARLRPAAAEACREVLAADEPALELTTRVARERRLGRPYDSGAWLHAETAAVRLDDALATGYPTAERLLAREPAALLLRYLDSAARREDAPKGAEELREAASALVRQAIAADAGCFARAVRRLAHRDADWRKRAHRATLAQVLA
ncbi:hypothetical protein BIV57_08700 [Mangrovactinospora gilvigrisea]|uniref:Uncharacterized protein n=1 Tax=Mangrovactinospora gilvigrisea TaxID=1428644 RepID=A0A1J7CE20_9ACTN|nr:hypothetical protein BIV57_08700 [Mangrovactinospora gilvigrisea]